MESSASEFYGRPFAKRKNGGYGRVEPNAELINIKRESKTARKLFRISGLSCFQGSELRHESLRRLQKSKPRSFVGGATSTPIESIFRSVCPNLDNVPLLLSVAH